MDFVNKYPGLAGSFTFLPGSAGSSFYDICPKPFTGAAFSRLHDAGILYINGQFPVFTTWPDTDFLSGNQFLAGQQASIHSREVLCT